MAIIVTMAVLGGRQQCHGLSDECDGVRRYVDQPYFSNGSDEIASSPPRNIDVRNCRSL